MLDTFRRGFAPVWTAVYQTEWERRCIRNSVHLQIGGCLGPCQLANVAMLPFDGTAIWFHSLNEQALIIAIFDYIDLMIAADAYLPPPDVLRAYVFNGFAWPAEDGSATDVQHEPVLKSLTISLESGSYLAKQE